MNKEQVTQRIDELLLPRLNEMGLYLVETRVHPTNKLEVFIDGDQNVTINQCVEISRYLESYLDSEGIVPENYNLEVSSPGMSNPLRIPRQYKKRIGRVLDIILQDGRKIAALLVDSGDESILVQEVDEEKQKKGKKKGKKQQEVTVNEELPKQEIPFSDIKKATIQFNF